MDWIYFFMFFVFAIFVAFLVYVELIVDVIIHKDGPEIKVRDNPRTRSY